MDAEHVEAIAQEWVGILGLQDWEIDYRYGDRDAERYGRVTVDAGSRKAIIRIYGNWNDCVDDAIEYPLEAIILHELTHCVLGSIDDLVLADKPKLTEHLCWLIPRLLLRLKRK